MPPPPRLNRVKPWPNGVASYRKLKTCINLRLPLAMTCVYLRWLAMTGDDLRSLGSNSNLHAIERKFFTVWPPNTSRRKLVSVLFSLVRAHVPGCTEMALLLPALYLRLVASPFGHPSEVCVRKFTFPNLRLLGTPFGQGFKDHGLLLTKLNACGVRGNDLALLSKYLIVRKQYVHIDGCHSSPRTVTARVPQRSILGPILFLLLLTMSL